MASRENSKKPPYGSRHAPVSNSMAGFDSQFSDLAYSACPPKRLRTNSGGKHTPINANKMKTPLKFDYRNNKMNEKIIPTKAQESGSNCYQKYISKPILPSQLEVPQVKKDDAFSQDDDWGEDGCDALLLAASQMEAPQSNRDNENNEEELLAMTALLEDDDFGLDDIADLEAAVEKHEEAERLNQTITVFL